MPCLPYYNMVFKLTDNGMSFLLLKELSLYLTWFQPIFDNYSSVNNELMSSQSLL